MEAAETIQGDPLHHAGHPLYLLDGLDRSLDAHAAVIVESAEELSGRGH